MTKRPLYINILIATVAIIMTVILFYAVLQIDKPKEPYYVSLISCAEGYNLYKIYTGVFWPELGGKIWHAVDVVEGENTIKTLKCQQVEAEKILKEIRNYRMLE